MSIRLKLAPGERIIVASRPHARQLVWPVVLAVLVCAAAGFVYGYLDRDSLPGQVADWHAYLQAAVVAVAASRASSAYLSSVDVLRTRTLAQFVAQNAAADLRIQDTWLTANKTQTINAQGRDWQVTMTATDAITPALKQVNIAVAPIIDGQARSAVTDIDLMLSNAEQEVGSLDLSRLNPNGGNP